ncbi:TetR/AcrR family transcriptional regulator [Caulobacter sp. KR2-114]|uniref:TetR/AcrR family transcriptional regulator n=1 Tax=Caulobacter sp. KR2-114 TaxID=3400912 RepID=UPI003C04D228
MSRPSTAKPRIDAAAITLFTQVGVDGATTKEIAALAGVSEGAIYRHYKSKDELAITLFMGVHRRLSTLVAEAAASARGIDAKAAAIVSAYCQVADENWPLFVFHMLSLHRFLPFYQEDGQDPVSVVENILKRAMMDCEVEPADPRVVAAMAIGAIVQTAQNRAYNRIDGSMTAHAPLMTAAVKAILHAR